MILRLEAALRMAQVLAAHGISVLQDIQGRSADDDLRRDLRVVPGQGPGTGVANLFMLAGDPDLIKFDRMVKRFLERVLDRRANAWDAQALLSEVAAKLGHDCRHRRLHDLGVPERGRALTWVCASVVSSMPELAPEHARPDRRAARYRGRSRASSRGGEIRPVAAEVDEKDVHTPLDIVYKAAEVW